MRLNRCRYGGQEFWAKNCSLLLSFFFFLLKVVLSVIFMNGSFFFPFLRLLVCLCFLLGELCPINWRAAAN